MRMRLARFIVFLVLAWGALAAPPSGVRDAAAQAPADSIPSSDEWLLDPSQPCIADNVTLFVRGFGSTPCDSFVFAGRVGERQVLIRTLVHVGRYCFAAPMPFAIPISFGMLPAGPQSIAIRHRFLALTEDGKLDSTTVDSEVQFEVASDCPPPPPPVPAGELPFVDRVGTEPSPPCPERPTSVTLSGHFRDGCGELVAVTQDPPGVVLAPYPPGPVACPLYLKPWNASFPLGFLQTGTHRIRIGMTVKGTNGLWPPILDQRYVGEFEFAVSTHCDSLPPGTGLPYVDFIDIAAASRPSSRIICPFDSIRVTMGGTFPNDCFRLKRIDLLDLWAGPLPMPPIVRLIVDDGGCLGRLCGGPVPWRAAVTLGPLPSRNYSLIVQLAQVSCSDSILPGNLYATSVPFYVVAAESCLASPLPCLLGWWERQAPNGGCDAFVSQGHPAQLTFQVSTGVSLSGFQGALRFHEPGMRISALETTGPAVGMHLSWTETDDGARFVMFAEHGAPIPASDTPVGILEVTAELRPWRSDSPDGSRIVWPTEGFHLEAADLLGADAGGGAVPDCSRLCPDCMFPPLPAPVARICLERECDFNADGVADVRDLVLMVHCVNAEGPCPPNAATNFDCNADGLFGVSDVLCCAVHVLRGPNCPDCPVDSVRAEPSVRASFGAPLRTERGVDVPLRLDGADRLGAARLALGFPSNRFDLASVSLGSSTAWLELHEARAGAPIELHDAGPLGLAAIGLIRTGHEVGPALDLVLHLELKPGADIGGEVQLQGGEFSGPDGVMLRVELGTPSQPLGEQPAMAISAIRPNPTPGAVRFSVTLNAASRLELGIYDVSGRRVAEIFRGERPTGIHDFVWDGRGSDGAPVREGVYFLRAAVGNRVAAKKLVLLRRGATVTP